MDRTQAQPEDEFLALEMCIGLMNTQKYKLDNSRLAIKTTQSEINNMLAEWNNLYTWEQILELTFCVELTYEEMKVEVRKIEWEALRKD